MVPVIFAPADNIGVFAFLSLRSILHTLPRAKPRKVALAAN